MPAMFVLPYLCDAMMTDLFVCKSRMESSLLLNPMPFHRLRIRAGRVPCFSRAERNCVG